MSSQVGGRVDNDVGCFGPGCLGLSAEGFRVEGVRRTVFPGRRRAFGVCVDEVFVEEREAGKEVEV